MYTSLFEIIGYASKYQKHISIMILMHNNDWTILKQSDTCS